MDIIEVGRSELRGRTFGKMQTLERGAGLQVLGFMRDVRNRTGYRLTVNEGRRSRPDQLLVWNEYALYLAGRGPWAPLAAQPYTSIHDEITHGNAVDFGGPGGEVIPANVHAVMVEIGPAYGVLWTGRNFPRQEWWHFEAYRDRAIIKVPEGTTNEEDDMFDENDRKRQERIEQKQVDLQKQLEQVYARLGKNPTDSASAVWKYGIDGYNGKHEARRRLAGIDAGKASTRQEKLVKAIVIGVAAVLGKPVPAEYGGPTPSTDDTKAGA